MPEWVVSLLISVGVTGAGIGVSWGVLSERVATLKEEIARKASLESVAHLEKRMDEIKSLLERLLERRED